MGLFRQGGGGLFNRHPEALMITIQCCGRITDKRYLIELTQLVEEGVFVLREDVLLRVSDRS